MKTTKIDPRTLKIRSLEESLRISKEIINHHKDEIEELYDELQNCHKRNITLMTIKRLRYSGLFLLGALFSVGVFISYVALFI